MKKLLLSVAFCALLTLSCFAQENSIKKTATYSGSFTDVAADSWYAANVADVYELELMNGVSDTAFDTESDVTVAQGVTIAARLNSIYYGKDIPEATEGTNWYDKYVAYAIDNGIITDKTFVNFDRAMKSYEMVQVFAKALPAEYYPAVNHIETIPDVTEELPFFTDVLQFYNAGILTGNDDAGWFYPTTTLSRKRAAAIISRVALPERRVQFSLTAPKEKYLASDLMSLAEVITSPATLDTIPMMTIGGRVISLAEYRYNYLSLAQQYKDDELKKAVEASVSIPAAVYNLSESKQIGISYDQMRNFLTEYYSFVLTYGDNFEALLSAYGMTERYFCQNEALYVLYQQEFDDLFGEGKEVSWTADDVIKYASDNDYICAKHILIANETPDAEKVAADVLAKVKAGEDFDALVKEYGEDPGMDSHPDGYYFNKGMMVESFENAAYALKEGEVSEVVKSDFGYHIIKRMSIDKETFTKSVDYADIENAFAQGIIDKYFADYVMGTEVVYSNAFDSLLELLAE